MIQYIRIQNFRSVKDIALELGPLNIVFGPNGCGKSNIYNAIHLLTAAAEGRLSGFISEEGGLENMMWSGCHAPHLHSERQLSHRDDADFIAELIDIGGCSPELRENQELMSLFLPLLRADFYATESYHYDSPDVCPPLRTPALLLCGSHDREASWQQVDAWRQWLSHVTGPVVIDGDHFYPIQQARSFFTQIVRHFPHAFSAMTALQKQPSTSER